MVRPLARLAAMIATLVVVMAALAVLSGWMRIVITQGTSMEPLYHQGDMIVTEREPSYRIGDIVAYHGGTEGLIVLHRIIGGTRNGWVIKGDNNESVDPHHPTSSRVLGRAVLHVARGGFVVRRLTSPGMLAATVIGVGALSGSAAAVQGRRRRRRRHLPQHVRGKVMRRRGSATAATARAELRPRAPARVPPAPRDHAIPPPGAPPPCESPPAAFPSAEPTRAKRLRSRLPTLPTRAPMPAPLATALAVAAALAVVALLGAAISWGRPTTMTSEQTSAPAQRSVQLGYTASVPPSAAYDGTTVTSPQPVFRALADSVQVHYVYRGVAAHLSTSLTVAAGNGWMSTRPLDGPVQVGSRYRGVTDLDLAGLSTRAAAAAAVIGSSAQNLTVTFRVHVVPQSGAAFTATLPMTLTTLSLAPAGTPQGTSSTGPSATRVTQVPATVHLGPFSPRVTTLREESLFLFLLALVGAGVVLVIARFAPTLSESDQILRDHSALIVPVSPVPSPKGRPVADVIDFAALARLAERYGLAVLHWERSGVSTFVVHDEGVTYRYRVDTEAENFWSDDPADASEDARDRLVTEPATQAHTSGDDFEGFWGPTPEFRPRRR